MTLGRLTQGLLDNGHSVQLVRPRQHKEEVALANRRQRELLSLGRPLLLGWSRKSTLGAITGRPVEERLAASVAAALAAVQRGARIVRVHDVAATADALKVWGAAGLGA